MKVYEADCIEHGDRFVTLFKTKETKDYDNIDDVYDMSNFHRK